MVQRASLARHLRKDSGGRPLGRIGGSGTTQSLRLPPCCVNANPDPAPRGYSRLPQRGRRHGPGRCPAWDPLACGDSIGRALSFRMKIPECCKDLRCPLRDHLSPPAALPSFGPATLENSSAPGMGGRRSGFWGGGGHVSCFLNRGMVSSQPRTGVRHASGRGSHLDRPENRGPSHGPAAPRRDAGPCGAPHRRRTPRARRPADPGGDPEPEPERRAPAGRAGGAAQGRGVADGAASPARLAHARRDGRVESPLCHPPGVGARYPVPRCPPRRACRPAHRRPNPTPECATDLERRWSNGQRRSAFPGGPGGRGAWGCPVDGSRYCLPLCRRLSIACTDLSVVGGAWLPRKLCYGRAREDLPPAPSGHGGSSPHPPTERGVMARRGRECWGMRPCLPPTLPLSFPSGSSFPSTPD